MYPSPPPPPPPPPPRSLHTNAQSSINNTCTLMFRCQLIANPELETVTIVGSFGRSIAGNRDAAANAIILLCTGTRLKHTATTSSTLHRNRADTHRNDFQYSGDPCVRARTRSANSYVWLFSYLSISQQMQHTAQRNCSPLTFWWP